MYVTIRSWMSWIMDVIGPELLELSVPELKKIAIFDFVYTLATAVSTKLGHNIYDHKISDEYDYGLNPAGRTKVTCP